MRKNTIRQLAVFGGMPEFAQNRHVGRPNLGDRERFLERVNDIWDRNWLTSSGPCVEEFERRIAELAGVKHCIATCNATIALELTIRALGLTGQVIVPSFTFVATVHALQWQEITPVFCDIEPDTCKIDPERIEELLTPLTTGIIGVHLWGRVCDVISLTEIAKRHNLKLLFDAAHAFGCSHHGHMVGSFGDAEVFSFHATKFVNTFEGGAVVTNNDELAGKLRLMKNFGFTGRDKVAYLGTNGKMSEVSAAMGLTSLDSMQEFMDVNRRNYRQYRKRLQGCVGVRLLRYDHRSQNNYQYISVEIDPEITGISRDDVIRVLEAERVLARRYFYPGCHEMEPYRSYFRHANLLLPVTERIKERILCLPTGVAMTNEDVDRVCEVLTFCVSHGHSISEQLERLGPATHARKVDSTPTQSAEGYTVRPEPRGPGSNGQRSFSPTPGRRYLDGD